MEGLTNQKKLNKVGIIDVSEIHPGRNFSMVGILVLGSLPQNAFVEAITMFGQYITYILHSHMTWVSLNIF